VDRTHDQPCRRREHPNPGPIRAGASTAENRLYAALKRLFHSQVFLLTLVIVVIVVVVSFLNPNFFSVSNFKNILVQISIVSIMAVGAGFVIISGGLDISVGSMTSLLAVVGAKLIASGHGVGVSVLITIAAAVGCGLVNGVLAAKTRVAPFIITLGTMSIFMSLSLIVGGAFSQLLSGRFQFLGRAMVAGVHFPTYVMVAVYLFFFFVMRYTTFGRRIYGMGGSEEVAFLAGINIPLYKIMVYVINALLVCLASLILISRTGSALPTVGMGLELKCIAAAIIGGVSLTGGVGTLLGIFLGSFLLGIIQNMLNILNLSAHLQSVVLGIVIVTAVTIGQRRRR
jgi:ribose/xylose/arabinose/galactoside ABC-type transport system permease subunit